jgi:hypothetical protein
LASELAWSGRRYSPRTLEGWLYEWRAKGFGALVSHCTKIVDCAPRESTI